MSNRRVATTNPLKARDVVERQHAADHEGRSHHPRALSERRGEEARRIGTERDTKGQLQASRCDVVRDHAEQSDSAERQRQQREAHERRRQHAPRGHTGRIGDDVPHRSAAHRQIAVEPRDRSRTVGDHLRVRRALRTTTKLEREGTCQADR